VLHNLDERPCNAVRQLTHFQLLQYCTNDDIRNSFAMGERQQGNESVVVPRTLMPNSRRPPDTTRRSCLCRVRRCELSRPDRPTSAFSVGVRPAVAPAVPAPPDTTLRR